MNKDVLRKAINKAQAKGLGVDDTVELIEEYLDIAGELGPGQPYEPPTAYTNGRIYTVGLQAPIENKPDTSIQPPPLVGRVLGASAPQEDYWTTDTLMKALGDVEWAFSAKPDGMTRTLDYVGSASPNPKNMPGVGVVFRCLAVSEPSEIPIFFPLSEKAIDPQARILEVKSQVEQLFRVRSTPVVNSTAARTSEPSMAELMGKGGMFGGTV